MTWKTYHIDEGMPYHYTASGIQDTDGKPAPAGLYIVRWDDDAILDGPYRPTAGGMARQYCRGYGHTGEVVNGKYPPVACVCNEAGQVVYNPRFNADLAGSALGGLINSLPSNYF